MNTGSILKKTPWQFQALPQDHLHPLTFLRSDVVLHVHELWTSGRHNCPTRRTFALPDITSFRPFYMMGVFACMDYIKSWHITLEDVERLRGFETLEQLPAAFWSYLISLPHFTGSIEALPDGKLLGDRPIKVSQKVRELYGDEMIGLDLMAIKGPSAEVALISEALAAIVDFSISVSADLTGYKRAGPVMMYFQTERDLHPYWAKLAATIESIIVNDNPLNKRLNKIWLWSDELSDPGMPARTLQARNDLQALKYDAGILSRMEIKR